jgi:hypothetical protein
MWLVFVCALCAVGWSTTGVCKTCTLCAHRVSGRCFGAGRIVQETERHSSIGRETQAHCTCWLLSGRCLCVTFISVISLCLSHVMSSEQKPDWEKEIARDMEQTKMSRQAWLLNCHVIAYFKNEMESLQDYLGDAEPELKGVLVSWFEEGDGFTTALPEGSKYDASIMIEQHAPVHKAAKKRKLDPSEVKVCPCCAENGVGDAVENPDCWIGEDKVCKENCCDCVTK